MTKLKYWKLIQVVFIMHNEFDSFFFLLIIQGLDKFDLSFYFLSISMKWRWFKIQTYFIFMLINNVLFIAF